MTGLVDRLRNGARRLVGRPSTDTLVLLYHRIAEPSVDPWRLSVSPAHFAEHLAVIKRAGRAMPLRELAMALRSGKRLRDAIVVTFDDGYADNLRAARSLLDRHDVPATVFVTSGALGSAGFWWDRLARTLLMPGTLPKKLRLQAGGETHRVTLGDDAVWDDAAAARHPDGSRGATSIRPHGTRPTRTFYDALFALAAEERERALAALPKPASTARTTGRCPSPSCTRSATTASSRSGATRAPIPCSPAWSRRRSARRSATRGATSRRSSGRRSRASPIRSGGEATTTRHGRAGPRRRLLVRLCELRRPGGRAHGSVPAAALPGPRLGRRRLRRRAPRLAGREAGAGLRRRVPVVTAITIFLDAERFLREAVASVLAQTHRDWELCSWTTAPPTARRAIARAIAERHPGPCPLSRPPGQRTAA